MVRCRECNQLLNSDNSAHVRCTNKECSRVTKCHCCEEPLGEEISKIICYICKELHCMYCDKDSFYFDVKWKEKQICESCHESNPHAPDFGPTYETIEDILDNTELQCINQHLEEECEGFLARLSDGKFICPICHEVNSEEAVADFYYG